MSMDKVYDSFAQAVVDIPDGASIMIGLNVAGPAGVAQNLILALCEQGAKNLTIIASNFGWVIQTGLARPFVTPAYLLEKGQIKKAVVNWTRANRPGEETPLEKAYKAGKVEFELMPMGVQSARIKAAGMGMGAFYSPVGVGTIYEKGREKRIINGREYILEYPLSADYAFVRASKADKMGNLQFRGTERAFNVIIAKACRTTIAEVDELVAPGEIDPDQVVVPGIYVDRIVRIPEGGRK